MILLINTCKERLHYYEFVKPIESFLQKWGVAFFVKHYKSVNQNDLKKSDKVIIFGTSLKDNEFLEDIKNFEWIRSFEKPVLGICAGMQIIGSIFEGKIKKKTEIGFYQECFKKSFLGLGGKQEVYHLHNNFIDFKKLKEFEIFAEGNGVPQAVKHKQKEIYGVLFHPEVRNKELIKNFAAK